MKRAMLRREWMVRLATCAVLAAALSQPAPVRAEPQDGGAKRPPVDDICRTLAQAAADNELPEEFFTRLIWQESRFDPEAVSPAGAQGIAQFMPQTAAARGLMNAFEPLEALQESASYLRELRTTFRGSLGLAAAAYNAGPGQVEAWLAGRRRLPFETQAYVRIVTGYAAEEWASRTPPQLAAATNPAPSTAPPGARCVELARLRARKLAPPPNRLSAVHAPRPPKQEASPGACWTKRLRKPKRRRRSGPWRAAL